MTARRFYESVTVASAKPPFGIALDGKPVRTPMKAPLRLPSRALADAIAMEWDGQGERILPHTMPLTKLANAAIDRIPRERVKIVNEIAAYAGSDLVCYRADGPKALVARETAAWQPVLDWALRRLDAAFVATQGISHRAQPGEALRRMRGYLEAQDDWRLTALLGMTALTGSALIAAMTADGDLAAPAAFAAAETDSDWQAEQWGADGEAAAKRRERQTAFLAACAFLQHLRSG